MRTLLASTYVLVAKKHNKSVSGTAQKIAVLRHLKNAEIDLGNENWHVKNKDFFISSKFALGHIFFVHYMLIGGKTATGTILTDGFMDFWLILVT
jgi:hypothetical protein